MIELIGGLKLRYGLKVVVVSNEARELNAYRIRQFKLDRVVDCVVSSCFVHVRKSEADIFRLALDIAQVAAGQVIYLENTPIASLGRYVSLDDERGERRRAVQALENATPSIITEVVSCMCCGRVNCSSHINVSADRKHCTKAFSRSRAYSRSTHRLRPELRRRRSRRLKMINKTLSPDLLDRINAYWRAANYLSVGQIYLYDNPLLLKQLVQDKLVEHKQYVDQHGQDLPEIRNWKWNRQE
jgi:XFP N-terminal domain